MSQQRAIARAPLEMPVAPAASPAGKHIPGAALGWGLGFTKQCSGGSLLLLQLPQHPWLQLWEGPYLGGLPEHPLRGLEFL